MVLGKFLSIEGTEGAGKSTALEFIKDYFHQVNIEAVWTREPGGTEIGEKIRDILLSTKEKEPLSAKAELLLMFAAREQHLQQVIIPALQKGQWVVTDRFIDASYAYQGGGREISLDDIKALDELVVGGTYPDLTLLLDLPPTLGLDRTLKRGGVKDRIEKETLTFFERVREIYLQRAQENSERIKIIDASKDKESVKQQIQLILKEFIVRH